MMLIECKEKGRCVTLNLLSSGQGNPLIRRGENLKTGRGIVGTGDMLTDLISFSQTSSPQISKSSLTSTRKALAISSLSNLDMNQKEEIS